MIVTIEIPYSYSNTLVNQFGKLVNIVDYFRDCVLCRYIVTKVYLEASKVAKIVNKEFEAKGKFKEYLDKYNQIIDKYAQKDSNGKPIIKNNKIVLTNDEEANKELQELNKQYKAVIEKRQKEVNKLHETFAKKTFEVTLPKVPVEQLTNIVPEVFTFLVKYDLVIIE